MSKKIKNSVCRTTYKLFEELYKRFGLCKMYQVKFGQVTIHRRDEGINFVRFSIMEKDEFLTQKN